MKLARPQTKPFSRWWLVIHIDYVCWLEHIWILVLWEASFSIMDSLPTIFGVWCHYLLNVFIQYLFALLHQIRETNIAGRKKQSSLFLFFFLISFFFGKGWRNKTKHNWCWRWCGSSCIPFKPVLMESCCFQIINSQQHKKKPQSKKLVWKPAIIFLRKKVVWKTNEHRGLADVCDATVFTRQKPVSDKRRRLLSFAFRFFCFLYVCFDFYMFLR